jgi:hypothetical protein
MQHAVFFAGANIFLNIAGHARGRRVSRHKPSATSPRSPGKGFD